MKTVLGEKIRTERKKNKLTLEGLAELSGSSKSYIWELENRPVVRPSADKISKIAQALDVTVEYLLDDEQDSPSDSDVDMAFFRRFKRLDGQKKDQLKRILEALDDE